MPQSRKKELIRELRDQREILAFRLDALKEELEPRRRLKGLLREHPVRWALAAGGASFLLARLLRSHPRDGRHSPKKKRHFLPGPARMAFALARPALTSYAFRKAQEHLESRFNPPPDNSMLGGPPQK